jgi:hypothetical protein
MAGEISSLKSANACSRLAGGAGEQVGTGPLERLPHLRRGGEAVGAVQLPDGDGGVDLVGDRVEPATFLGVAGAAEARQVRYVGVHPLPGKAKATCHIEVAHVHVFAPERPDVLYRKQAGAYVFVGDPVAHGYDGPHQAYYGHHPLHVDVLVDGPAPSDDDLGYCYLDGPHFHAWAPPADVTFTMKGGAYWYVGAFPPEYKRERRRYEPINVYYRPIVYVRPEVAFDAPPPGYLGPVVDGHVAVDAPGVEPPHVDVVAPAVRAGVEVHVPVPTIEVGIGVGLSGGVVVGGGGGRGRRHDNGLHRGHYKRKH